MKNNYTREEVEILLALLAEEHRINGVSFGGHSFAINFAKYWLEQKEIK